MTTKKDKQHLLFSDTEQFLCACGCGQFGFRSKRSNRRRYLNATHKKRAQRARIKDAYRSNIVRFTPTGWLYFFESGQENLHELWDSMNDHEKAIIVVMCETGLTPHQFLMSVQKLFGIQKSAIEHNLHVWEDGI